MVELVAAAADLEVTADVLVDASDQNTTTPAVEPRANLRNAPC
jgi:hypothetical protein